MTAIRVSRGGVAGDSGLRRAVHQGAAGRLGCREYQAGVSGTLGSKRSQYRFKALLCIGLGAELLMLDSAMSSASSASWMALASGGTIAAASATGKATLPPVKPCLRPFRRNRAFPSPIFGPGDSKEFSRFAVRIASVKVAGIRSIFLESWFNRCDQIQRDGRSFLNKIFLGEMAEHTILRIRDILPEFSDQSSPCVLKRLLDPAGDVLRRSFKKWR